MRGGTAGTAVGGGVGGGGRRGEPVRAVSPGAEDGRAREAARAVAGAGRAVGARGGRSARGARADGHPLAGLVPSRGAAAVEARHAGGRGAPSFLAPEQREELAAEVATGRFRTAAEIRAWVRERWGVAYTEGGMYALLGRLRCAPKVPRPIHAKADPAAQARWKKGGSRRPSRRSA